MMSRLLCMLAIILAMATMTWGLVAWADDLFSVDPLWPLHGAARLHPIHLIGMGLATLPLALHALLVRDRPANKIMGKAVSKS